MKRLPTVLVVSLVANLALLLAYTKSKGRAEAAQPSSTAATGVSSGTDTSISGAAKSAEVAASARTAALARKRPWSEIETDDLDELGRRLKASGFSSREISAIMSLRISEKYQTGWRLNQPYWRVEYANYNDPAVREKQAEMDGLYRKYVFGPDHIADDPEQLAMARQHYGPLSVEKLQAVATIVADFQEEMMKRQNRLAAVDPEGARADYIASEKEKENQIKAALTSEEYAIYELRGSMTAVRLRSQLATFVPSEEEYKTIFAIQKSFNDRMADSKLSKEGHQALQAEMMNHLTSALGADRALDYQEATRGGDKTSQLVAALGLPARVTGQVRTMQEDFTARAKNLRADAQLPAAERSAQLTALAQEARTKLGTTFGPEGFEAYNDMKGEWIRALEPK